MCGRFTQSYTWRELVELYRLTQPALNLRSLYNIAPTTAIDVVRSGDAHSELVSMHWGSCLAANGFPPIRSPAVKVVVFQCP
jgi:putative SOS response-associated peptidase YedK